MIYILYFSVKIFMNSMHCEMGGQELEIQRESKL